jgi:hypothetical protein
MPYVDFISDADFISAVGIVVDSMKHSASKKIKTSGFDPFTAIFECSFQGTNLTAWEQKEKERQDKKTLQNCIGEFHQRIIGSIKNCRDLGVGNGIDIENINNRWIAEIKNKHNTVKGSDKKHTYDTLERYISSYKERYKQNFFGYYVEIISKKAKSYDEPFTPSDNSKKGLRRPLNQQIRVISGDRFYDLASGKKNALKQIYTKLPTVIEDNFGFVNTSVRLRW